MQEFDPDYQPGLVIRKPLWSKRPSNSKDVKGWEILTPQGRVWCVINNKHRANQICGIFNYTDELTKACKNGNMQEINEVLLAYKKES